MASRHLRDIIRNQIILTLPAEASVRAAARAMAERRVGSVMIVEAGRLKGIFTERDALFRVLAQGLDPDTTALSAVMTENVTTLDAGMTLGQALHQMHDGGFRHVPVTEMGRPVGMVSIRDALATELASFEREVAIKESLVESLR